MPEPTPEPTPDREVALIVDDSEQTRHRLSTVLRRGGLDVVEAASGAEAMQLLESRPIDVVILDVDLPDMSGFDVAEWIKAHPTLGVTPVLHVSATFTDTESRSTGLRRGADGYLVEPLEPIELLATVEALLRYSRARRHAEWLARTLDSLHGATLAINASRNVDTFVEAVLAGARETFGANASIILTGEGAVRIEREADARRGWVATGLQGLPTVPFDTLRSMVESGPARVPVDGLSADGGDRAPIFLVPFHVRSGAVVGVLALELDLTGDLRTIVSQYALAVGVAFENLRATERSRSLAVLGRRMSEASTLGEVAVAVVESARTVVGAMYAALATVDPFHPDRIEMVVPGDVPEAISQAYRHLEIDQDFGPCVAIRESRMVVTQDADHSNWRARDRLQLGIHTSVSVPLVSGTGQPFGALALAWEHHTEIDDDIATRLATVADFCARGVERSLTAEARSLRASRTSAVALFAQALAPARSVADVQQVVARQGHSAVGSEIAALLINADLTVPGDPDESVDRRLRSLFVSLGVGDLTAVGAAQFRGRVPAPVIETGRQTVARERAVAALPLQSFSPTFDATLALAWAHPMDFDDTQRAELATIAELIGQTLERARLHDAEHALVESFQRRALQPIPHIPGISTVARYLSAGDFARIGGDFYDGIALNDHTLAVVLGDITGHGIEAAAHMVQIRTKLHTLLSIDTPLGEVFRQADRAMATEYEFNLATAVIVVLDAEANTVSHVSAGHPPILRRDPSGHVEIVGGGRRALLGVGGGSVEPEVLDFSPGTVLLVYTDGLIERPGEIIDEGFERLARLLERTTDVDTLVAEMTPDGPRRDDIALVLLTRDPDGITSASTSVRPDRPR